MCGIAGIWRFNSSLVMNELRRFTDSLKDRGPDGAGYELLNDGRLGFGHRRLSILDLSPAGRQPMSYGNERYWITFNGEIYNFLEIRRQLQGVGFDFRTESDTEVLLAAYHNWGKNCLLKFNGMFAFAIWDTERKSLFIARDRFGVKPLHYVYKKDELFAFASETYAFRFLYDLDRKIDEQKLSIALEQPDLLEGSGHTIFQGIFQLLPGHYIEFSKNTSRITQVKWWETLNHRVSVPVKYEEQVEQFGELFEDACRIRLRSDAPFASALSGGLDSSAIYCTINKILQEESLGSRISSKEQKAFVAYFPDTPNDEKKYAEEVIRYTTGSGLFIEPEYKNLINDLVITTKRFDAIAGTPILCATGVYKAMYESGYRVSLDGHGADEMLYGYKQMVFNAYQTAILNGNTAYGVDMLNTYANLFFDELQTSAKISLSDYGKSITPSLKRKLVQKFMPGQMARRDSKNAYKDFKTRRFSDSWLVSNEEMALEALSDLHFQNYVTGNDSQDTYNLFHYTSLPINLRDFDRASMQNGIEIRSPFMDWRLVAFVFSLPTASKVGDGFTKRILRDSMTGKMPESIRTRKLKIGLSAPLPQWFNSHLKEFITDIVASHHFQNNSIWDGTAIKKLVEHRNGSGWQDFNECAKVWKYLSADLLIKESN